MTPPPETDRPHQEPRRKLYGRRHGKALRPRQRELLDELLPQLQVPGVAPPGDQDRAPVEPRAIFPEARALWVEVGFGAGEHLVYQAQRNPDVGLIGCEPYVNGVAMALARIAEARPGNVRLHPGDARDLIELLPPASVERVFLLYPDPWPKARHHRRRFMHPDNLAMLARIMPPGAVLRLATDIADYVEHALAAVAASETFRLAPDGGADHARPWPDWPGTRYEAKAVRDRRRPHYLTFVRV